MANVTHIAIKSNCQMSIRDRWCEFLEFIVIGIMLMNGDAS